MKPAFPSKKKNNTENLFEELFFEFIEKKYSISKNTLCNILEQRQLETKKNSNNNIPISILNTASLSSLESVVKFLRENKRLSYAEIGKLLYRNPKALAVSYAVSKRKMSSPFPDNFSKDTVFIPLSIFSSDLSVLESMCSYLHSKENSFSDISRMLNLDPRTVWTVCHRAQIKLSKINKTALDKKNSDAFDSKRFKNG